MTKYALYQHLLSERILLTLIYLKWLDNLISTTDPNGNRTSMNRLNLTPTPADPLTNTAYNAANHMLTFSDKNITYDENGNMTSATNGCGTTTYTWDARNRLIGINGFKTDCSSLSASFKYDALGRRTEKTVNGRTIQYLYDGWDIVQEIEGGIISANYIRTLNIDETLARIKSDGTIRYYQQDALGSVIALTDETGAVKTQYSYDPFGNTTVNGEASDNPFQYTGRENDGTGLLFERNRYYSFELQRYISEDPIGLAGGDVNFYVRVRSSPVNFTDPLGLRSRKGWVPPDLNPPGLPPTPDSPDNDPFPFNPPPREKSSSCAQCRPVFHPDVYWKCVFTYSVSQPYLEGYLAGIGMVLVPSGVTNAIGIIGVLGESNYIGYTCRQKAMYCE